LTYRAVPGVPNSCETSRTEMIGACTSLIV
jgi:hypothetical protein